MPQIGDFVFYGAGIAATCVSAVSIKRRVATGHFGKFAIFEHLIIPSIFLTAGLLVYFLLDVQINLSTASLLLLVLGLGIIIFAVLSAPLMLPLYLLGLATFTWADALQTAAFVWAGATLGNLVGFALGTRQTRRGSEML